MFLNTMPCCRCRNRWTAALLILAAVSVMPYAALAEIRIPFSVKNKSSVDLVSFNCEGTRPLFLRDSAPPGLDVDAGKDSGVFYTSTDSGIGSPFGEWNCSGFLSSHASDPQVNFCLVNTSRLREVVIVLEGEGDNPSLSVEGFRNLRNGESCSDSPDIPFSVDNKTDAKVTDFSCNQMTGDIFDRRSGTITVEANENKGVFYTAENGAISQYGKWRCEGKSSVTDEANPAIDFCLYDDPNLRQVPLFIVNFPRGTPFQGLELSGFPSPNSRGVCGDSDEVSSYLGDGPRSGRELPPRPQGGDRPDRDHWIVDGNAGDMLGVRLDRDGSRGSAGDEVTVVLRGHGAARHFKKKVTGPVPLEFEERLPEGGTYSVAIEQRGVRHQNRFFGYYKLRVSSDLLTPIGLRPHATVEE